MGLTQMKPKIWQFLPVVIALGILCSSCEAPMPGRFTPLGQTYPARPKDAKIEVIQEGKPARPFTEVARLDVHIEQSFFAKPELKTLMPELKKQARLAGADAIMDIHERRSMINETQTLHVTATAIKFNDPP